MAYMVVHLNNKNEVNYPIESFPELISELDGVSNKESYVALTHESEWCLSLYANRILVWNNNISALGESWFLLDVKPEKVVRLWEFLSNGDLESVWKEKWNSGDPMYDT